MRIKPLLLVAACSLIAWQGIAQNPQNGAYFLRSALGRHLDVQWGNANAGTPMHLWDFNGGVAQKWRLQKTPQGFYTIQSDLGRYLDVSNASNAAGTVVHLWDYNGSVAQQWFFTPAGDGSYFIKSAVGTYLDVQNAAPAAGTPVWMYSYNGSIAQRWFLEPAGAINNTPGSIGIGIIDAAGRPVGETKGITFRLYQNGEAFTSFDPQHLGRGLVKLENIPPGTYTIQAFYTSGDGLGGSFSFVEEIRLSPDEQAVTVLAGVAVEITFRNKQ